MSYGEEDTCLDAGRPLTSQKTKQGPPIRCLLLDLSTSPPGSDTSPLLGVTWSSEGGESWQGAVGSA